MWSLGVSVVFDATHSVQESGGLGNATGAGNLAQRRPEHAPAQPLGRVPGAGYRNTELSGRAVTLRGSFLLTCCFLATG